MFYNTADYNQKPSWNINVAAGQTGTLVASGRCVISGSISGAGTLYYNVPYVRADLVAGGANFTGKMVVTTDADGGSFRITTNANGFPMANIQLSALVDMGAYSSVGASSAATGTTVKIGSLSGDAGSTVGAGTWQIGSDNRDAVFNGIFNSGATITKLGTGNWTISGANLCSSVFTVSAGKLIVSNTAGSATGTGTVIINNSATLAGTGIISGGAVINSGAILSPGNAAIGTLSFGSNLVLQTGSKTVIKVSGTSTDKLAITGTIALKGTLEMQNSGAAYQVGNSYAIFTAASATGMFDAISPASPGVGLKWNTTRITEGIISVDSTITKIEDISEYALKIYPNIVTDYCFISIAKTINDLKVEVINEVGSIVFTNIINSNLTSYKLNMTGYKSGLYLIKLTNNNSYSLSKVIKK